MRLIKSAVLIFIFSAASVFPMGTKEDRPESITPHAQLYLSGLENQASEQSSNRAEQVMKALLAAYPRQIDRVEFRNGDWAVLLRGTWFYYSGGRLLPENLLASAESFSSQPFYRYPRELPPWRQPSAEEAARFSRIAENRRGQLRRSSHFFDTLWRASDRESSYERIKTIRFLGKPINVHHMIMENLALVEEQIRDAARTDRQVQTWINSIGTMEGWVWRDIAEMQARSFHAYGLAVDLLPRSLGGKETYWLWAARNRTDWWNVSYNERYHPPAAVIRAFENYGFIWGGKWLFYDTMHFEYRPDILILNGMPPETRR